MSGGSYNYLCFRDAAELLNERAMLKLMAADLQVEGAAAAAAATEELLAYVEHAHRQIEARAERLRPVWKALEWFTDGDTDHVSLIKTVKEYDGQ